VVAATVPIPPFPAGSVLPRTIPPLATAVVAAVTPGTVPAPVAIASVTTRSVLPRTIAALAATIIAPPGVTVEALR
jgi:hypothetical protein